MLAYEFFLQNKVRNFLYKKKSNCVISFIISCSSLILSHSPYSRFNNKNLFSMKTNKWFFEHACFLFIEFHISISNHDQISRSTVMHHYKEIHFLENIKDEHKKKLNQSNQNCSNKKSIQTNLLDDYVTFVDTTKKQNANSILIIFSIVITFLFLVFIFSNEYFFV